MLPLFLCSLGMQAQKPREIKQAPQPPKKEIPMSRFSVKAGAALSVVYLSRNTKDWNNEPGFSAGLGYEINNFVRLSGLFTSFRGIEIEPTWNSIKAHTYEVNLEIQAHFPNKKTLLYPFTGLSLNTYKGFFTGENDFLGLKEHYQPNTTVRNNWLGLNIGMGAEHNFRVLGLFVDYRMRIGRQENGFNIMDVTWTGGVKIKLPQANGLKKIFRNPGDRFHWF